MQRPLRGRQAGAPRLPQLVIADDRSAIQIGQGARRAEAVLLEAACERLADPATAVAAPLQIVVPSHSLREHLLTRLVQVAGHGLLGVRCSTHRALALQILANRGIDPPRGLDLFAVLARRFASHEPILAEALDHLVDGYAGMLGSVRDLLDAGFQIPHLAAIEEALYIEGPAVASKSEIERAAALARVTARILAAFDDLAIGRSSTLLQQATDAVLDAPAEALTTSAVLLHGFADATGVTADFLQALLRAYGGRLIVDRPPDPVDHTREDSSAAFVDRFLEPFQGIASIRADPSDTPPPRIELFRALGRHAEVREVAHRVLDLLDADTPPESIGVVLREPTPYRGVLRSEFRRLGIPFSGQGVPGPLTSDGRRLRALQELLSQGRRCHVERWLDALIHPQRSTPMFDLRVALSALGIARLEQLAELDLEVMRFGEYYPLPVRRGFFETADEVDGQREIRSRKRRVPRADLERLVAIAKRLSRDLEAWRSRGRPLAEHADRLRQLIETLGWSEAQAIWRPLEEVLDQISLAPPIAVELEELVPILRRQLNEAGLDRFGGRGAGVQVMGVVEARGRTFEHLFLLGLNRNVFPRTVREDPVLSDSLRRLLERGGHGVLPDLPIKRRGYDEERYLFAHLLSSSPRVTLSWLELDENDRAVPASPLIERLRWTHPDRPQAWRSPPVVGRHPVVDGELSSEGTACRIDRLPLEDQAVLAGLHGRASHFPTTLGVALRLSSSGDRQAAALEAQAAAAARIGILDTLDPASPGEARSCLSPYLGFLGTAHDRLDPRTNAGIAVTTLERMAACPWQTFVERLLHIESVPDPLEALPQIDSLLIGIVTHQVLQDLVDERIQAPSFDAAREAATVAVPWPADDALSHRLVRAAETTVREAGIALPGFANALATVARRYLETARALDWSSGDLESVVGAEVEGALSFAAPGLRDRHLLFRADRIDRDGDRLVIVDYKTGRPAFTQKTPKGRSRAFLREVGQGARLQAVAYALAAARSGDEGRFEYLKPQFDGPPEARVVGARAEDTALRQAFLVAVETTLTAWELGVFFPRLERPGKPHEEPRTCSWCTVSEACLRQDSGSRRRLREGLGQLEPGAGPEPALVDALLDQWWLTEPVKRPPSGEPGASR